MRTIPNPSLRSLASSLATWGLAAGLCLAGHSPAAADGGVTFTNVAAAAGIGYERTPTPSRKAVLDQLYATGLQLPNPNIVGASPMKPYGSPGVALLDYDRDGDLDLYVTNGPGTANSLFANQQSDSGELAFVDVAAQAGVAAAAQDSAGVCYGDVDNDGDLDLYVTGIGEPNVLFENLGDGTFRDVTASAGAGAGSFHHSACALADFNGDGRLDILVGNTYGDWNNRLAPFSPVNLPMEPNQLLLQDTGGAGLHFTDVSAASGLHQMVAFPDAGTITWSVAAADYDQDGDTDILWADFQGRNPANPGGPYRGYPRVFENDGAAHFTDRTMSNGIELPGSYQGLSFGDYNCDGNVDFFATNIGFWVGAQISAPRWFLGNGAGGFHDPLNEPGLGLIIPLPFAWGTSTADYDNDGDQDIVLYGDDDRLTLQVMDNPGTLLRNQGCTAHFALDTAALTTDHRFRQVHGLAMGDVDGDGFEDIVSAAALRIVPTPSLFRLYTTLVGPTGSPLDAVAAFQIVMTVLPSKPGFLSYLGLNVLPGDLAVEVNSGGNGNGSAAVRLVGGAGLVAGGRSNRDGIGAVVRFTPEGGTSVLSPVVGGGSHASQDSLDVHFGLGAAPRGTVDVLWPGGTRNRLYDVAAGERVLLPEIPCSVDGEWKSFGDYNSCVQTSLNRFVQQGVIDHGQRQRLAASAARAFAEGR